MTHAKRKQGAKYAFVAFRPNPLLDRRLRSLAARTGQSVSSLVKECVAAHISTLEQAAKEVA